MIQEEDDMTQEIRALVMLETAKEVKKFIDKIESSRIAEKDEWSIGLNQGLDWSVRILNTDKSAS
jgi:hypothetical protein